MTLGARLRGARLLRPLRIRDFRLVWIGETISLLGDQFHFVALAWLTLQLTGSGLALGTVLMAAAVPRAIFMLVGGALTDRFSPRQLMLVSNSLRAVVVGVIAALVLTEAVQLWHLYVLAVIFGVVDAFYYPAVSAITPRIVGEDDLAPANALVHGTAQLMQFIGPALAGVLVFAAGTGLAFTIDSISFVVATLTLLLMRSSTRAEPRPALEATLEPAVVTATAPLPSDSKAPSAPPESSGLLGTIAAGLAYTWRDPAIRTLIVLVAVINFASAGPLLVGLPWLAANRFLESSIAFGVMFSGWGLGAFFGAFLAGSLPTPRRPGQALLAIATSLGIGQALIGLAPHFLVVTVLLAAMGIGGGYVNVAVIVWLQARVEPQMLGRVMSVLMLGAIGLAPVSYALGGLVVDLYATLLFVASGALIVLAVLVSILSGSARQLDADSPVVARALAGPRAG